MFSATRDELRQGPAIPRLLHLVILMALRDNGTAIRIQGTTADMRMFYFCPNSDNAEWTWYELVPPPVSLWPHMVKCVQDVSTIHIRDEYPLKPSKPPPNSWWSRSSQPPQESITFQMGLVQHRIENCTSVWAVQIDTIGLVGSIALSLVEVPLDASVAGKILGEMLDEHGYIEFDDL